MFQPTQALTFHIFYASNIRELTCDSWRYTSNESVKEKESSSGINEHRLAKLSANNATSHTREDHIPFGTTRDTLWLFPTRCARAVGGASTFTWRIPRDRLTRRRGIIAQRMLITVSRDNKPIERAHQRHGFYMKIIFIRHELLSFFYLCSHRFKEVDSIELFHIFKGTINQ